MTIVTAANKKLKKIININIIQIRKFGYKYFIYDLGGLGFGKAFKVDDSSFERSPIPTINWKPRLLLDAFEKINDFIVWLDADAILYGSIDEVQNNEYDFGVTLRRQNEIGKTKYPHITGYLNAGVIFINHTRGAKKLLKDWVYLVNITKSDQEALNMLVGEVCDWKKYNIVIKKDETRIKIFKTDNYNYFYFNEKPDPKKNKILHFKGSFRKYVYKYFPLGGKNVS